MNSPLRIEGVALSKGIAYGKVHILTPTERNIPQYLIEAKSIGHEIGRFQNALARAETELQSIRKTLKISKRDHPSITAFVDLYSTLLHDATITKRTEELISKRKINAEWALQQQAEELSASFESIESDYLKERKHDIEHVAGQIMQAMRKPQDMPETAARGAGAGMILVATSISPTDVLEYSQRGYQAFATEAGGPNSHAAIIARSMRIPFLGKVPELPEQVSEEDFAILDAIEGVIEIRPTDATLRSYKSRKRSIECKPRASEPRKRKVAGPVKTKDGVEIFLQANVELPDEVEEACRFGAGEIGLFRTESLMLSLNEMPSEEEQYEMYRNAVDKAQGIPITFRTLDIGGDKFLPGMEGQPDVFGSPLGLRAIRYCLSHPQIFLRQLRALLRTAHHGPVRILFPMLTHPVELTQTVSLLEIAKEQLSNRRLNFPHNVQIGAMIEVPAAVFVMDDFAHHLDFFSIGSNDLIQYMLAVDREDEKVATLNDPLHPAIIHMLKTISQKGKNHAMPVTLCGEMAGDSGITPLLLGMGLRRFSMQIDRIGKVRETVAHSDTRNLRKLAKKALDAESPEAVAKMLNLDS